MRGMLLFFSLVALLDGNLGWALFFLWLAYVFGGRR